jgi:hypothetical protein
MISLYVRRLRPGAEVRALRAEAPRPPPNSPISDRTDRYDLIGRALGAAGPDRAHSLMT